ncbi:MAG TPA: AbrB/MazE/SpoVT family DNA-binding domain-containing protein [Clostridiaceae bacterium]
MKSIGIVRRLDELGRIVLPAELRKSFKIDDKGALEIFTDGEYILLKKYEPGCTFCGEIKVTKEFMGKVICDKCLNKLKL